MKTHTERTFESEIEAHLLAHGYAKGVAEAFDAKRALFPAEVLVFVQATQPKTWEAIEKYYGPAAPAMLLDDLCKSLATLGMLHVLRNGFNCFGKTVRMAYFAPATAMNPETLQLYAANQLTMTRQVHHSVARPKDSVDLVLALNGLPLATAELKNPLTGQNVFNAMQQYRNDRDAKDTLFAFKQRALVHFAVDPDQVMMSTRVDGRSTHFLPFNLGNGTEAGNPPNPQGHKTAYLWQRVWQRDSLLDIFGRFMHLLKDEKEYLSTRGGKTTVQKKRSETLIFPRYHQLDAVRQLTDKARSQGPGHNYLVQHSAGSGKSNTIAWLAHRLSNLHNAQDGKVFDCVIVITDRRVLDKQLQDTVFQFDHKQGVVKKIDEDSGQLAQALKDAVPIIITTLQKFPFVTEKVGELENRNYAVIVDEAHSSQSGEQAAELKGILNEAGIHHVAEQRVEFDVVDDPVDKAVLRSAYRASLRRGKQPNISFFAFTATPKFKTLSVFNEAGDDGNAPFHRYTMRQAIDEGFILDVLKNYTSYDTYFGLINASADDPLVERKQAAKALARFMQHHPHNLASRVEVMVEHFRTHTRHKIGGRAKAMVVTDSRLSAVRYKLTIDKYIAHKGYQDIRTLVAFSGTVADPDFPDKTYTEESMNGIKESELPAKFATDDYQVLLVAEKYQTGFDQPLLHTMYVDKRLDGVQAVQTLSRLNRTCAGKEDTFVLDFRNKREDIFRAFKPYYEVTERQDDQDLPMQLYRLQTELRAAHVFTDEEVHEFCTAYYGASGLTIAHASLNRWLDPAVQRFSGLEDEDAQLEFRARLKSFLGLYGFLAQVIPYQDTKLEKLFTYLRYLSSKLPPVGHGQMLDLGDDVQLKFYRLQKIEEGQIQLGTGDAMPLRAPGEGGTGNGDDEELPLSTLVKQLNDRFGTAFTTADQLFFDQIEAQAVARDDIRQAAQANTIENFKLVFDQAIDGLFIDRMEGNDDIFRRVMQDEKFRSVAAGYLLDRVYRQAQTEQQSGK